MFSLTLPLTKCNNIVEDNTKLINPGNVGLPTISHVDNNTICVINSSKINTAYGNYYSSSPGFTYRNDDNFVYETKDKSIYVGFVNNTLIDIDFKRMKTTYVGSNNATITRSITLNNQFVDKDIDKRFSVLDNELLNMVGAMLDENKHLQMGTLVLDAVYDEYYPALLKLGDDIISKYNTINVYNLPTFIFYNEKTHTFSGSIYSTNNFQFIIVFDNILYLTILVQVSVREII